MTGPVRGIPWTRLLAEGIIIVVSILLAFAIDAWWDAAQDRSREMSYLSQLATDLERTLENIERFGSIADNRDSANARLVSSYYQADAPSADSLAGWLNRAIGYRVVQPRLGTVEALVSTGDLALIRDDSLRAAIPAYLNIMQAFEGFEADGERMFVEAVNQLVGSIDPYRIQLELITVAQRDSMAAQPFSPLPSGRLRTLPALDLLETVRSPEVHHLLVQMVRAKELMRIYRGEMKSNAERMLELVRSAQANQ